MAEMASAQLMEEELQHSVMVSEEDGDFEVDGAAESTATDKADTVASSTEINVRGDDDGPEDQDMDGEAASEDLEEEGSGANHQESSQNGSAQESQDMEIEDGPEDEDAEGEDDDGAYEQDAEGEEDEEDMTVQPATSHGNALETPDDADQDAEGDEDDEGVGAVKIRPGEDDEEEEEEDEDEGSEASEGSEADAQSASDEESEGEEAWEDNAENEEDDEEEENVNSNVCMFCKQDEENDPSEEFETFLACKGCGENAHQQCARENDAIDQRNGPEKWKCPECYDAEREDALLEEGEGEDAEGEEQEGEGDENTSPSSRISNGRLGRELLPAPKPKPDSHSVFNQLVLDEDPMDGSRVLRKRKTSSAEVDEEVMSLRKRRKDTGDEMSVDGETDGEETPRPRSSRSLRQKATNTPSSASITKKTRNSLVVKATLNAAELKKITSQKPKGALKPANKASTSRSSRPGTSRSSVHVGVPLTAPFVSTNFTQPFYSFFDKDTDELKGKPYGGILTEAEADTSKTLPTSEDRRRFDEAKQKAEEEWRERLLRMQEENELPVKKAKKASGPASQIECIEFGGWEIDTWYAAPYPEEYSRNRVLYICEFCLKYMNSDYVAWRHKLKCPAKHPPGDEIYRHGSVSVFEVDGRKNPVYCQNLCLLAKLFLGSKTLYYDVEPFLFYVLCEFDDLGYHFVGYFSKEKRASSQNNVSCILTLPIHQRKGYGNLLIDFSYLLTRVEQKTGSPEKPLSDMGLVSYRNYWRLVLSRYLLKHVPEDRFEPKGLSIKQISDDTGLTPDDVISALEGLRCLVRDPPTGVYAFRVDLAYCQEYVAKWEAKKYVTLNPAALTWTPYVMGRNNVANFELGPALTAMASAGDEEEPKPTNGETSAAHKAVNGDGPAPGEVVKAEVDVDANVMESTEPNETSADTNGLVNGEGQAKPDGEQEQEQNHNAAGAGSVERSHSSAISKKAEDEDWTSAYKTIPPTRFVVYPPLNARRVDRPRPTLGSVATPVVRTMSASRPRPRRSIGGGSARRASASKPKSSSKRKTGGTGRGPGRWPKGTKKSDYGGADSGPGMPPGWLESRKQAQAAAQLKRDEKKKAEREDQAEDTVQVQTITTANAVNGSLHSAEGGGDVVMADGDGDDE